MLALPILQEGPNVGLYWLLYVVIGLLLLAIVVGAWTSRKKTEAGSKSKKATEIPATKKQSTGRKPRKSASKKQSTGRKPRKSTPKKQSTGRKPRKSASKKKSTSSKTRKSTPRKKSR